MRCLRAYYAELNRRVGHRLRPRRRHPPPSRTSSARPPGAFFVAYLRGEAIGCGGVKHHGGAPAEIKRMWVAESARGLGWAGGCWASSRRARARAAPRALSIETNATLVEAIALYRSAGYVEVPAFNDEPFADHWFEKSFADVEAHKLDTTRKLPRHKSRPRRA